MLKALMPFTVGVRKVFVISFMLSVLSMLLSFFNPYFYKLFINEVILNGQLRKLAVVITGYLGVFFANVLIDYAKNYAGYTLANATLYRVRSQILQGFFEMPFSAYETTGIGDMKMRLDDDTEQIRKFAGMQTIDYTISFLTMLGSLIMLSVIDWRLTLFAVIAIPLTFLLDGIISKREAALNDSNRENDQKLASWLHDSIQGWREVKALNLGRSQERKFVHFLHNYALYYSVWINYWTARALVIPKIKDEFFMKFGLYFFGGILIMNGEMKIGDLLVFAMYYELLSNSVKFLSDADADLQSNMPLTDRLLAALHYKDSEKKAGLMPDGSNEIVLQDICFTYPGTDREVLHHFHLCIHKGDRIAITGKSGGGKTTILKLITGMLQPTFGTVSFSGVDLKQIDLNALHARIGFVMQENALFHTTIRENLLYGKENASEEELLSACQKACIYDYIIGLKDGLDTVIGERGLKLSGGQRQRIVLTRLFLRDVDIFIFDEATSALDPYSENLIQDAIKNIGNDKTIIVVAHRESSIQLCNRIIRI